MVCRGLKAPPVTSKKLVDAQVINIGEPSILITMEKPELGGALTLSKIAPLSFLTQLKRKELSKFLLESL